MYIPREKLTVIGTAPRKGTRQGRGYEGAAGAQFW